MKADGEKEMRGHAKKAEKVSAMRQREHRRSRVSTRLAKEMK